MKIWVKNKKKGEREEKKGKTLHKKRRKKALKFHLLKLPLAKGKKIRWGKNHKKEQYQGQIVHKTSKFFVAKNLNI